MPVESRARFGLTRSGKAAAVGGAVTLVAGRVAGIEELSVAGVCLLVLVAASLSVVRAAGSDLAVRRTVRPRRVEVGDQFTVSLQIHNGRSGLRLPLVVGDSLDGRRVVQLSLPQRRKDPACVAEYTVGASRRGLATFGPVTIRSLDPFAFARTDLVVPALIDVIVLPQIHRLGLSGALAADDPSGGLRHRRQIATVSEEFDTLREYVPGDDVRRVHWASTARLGRPMVRTHQQPSQRRTTVVLDDRADAYPPSRGTAPFERAISAAASALVACREQGDLVRLVCAGGSDSDYFDDPQRMDTVLDQLAAASTSAVGSLRGALATATAVGSGDRVVVCTGTIGADDRAAISGSASRGGEHVAITTGDGAPATSEAKVLNVTIGESDDLDRRWQAAVRARAAGPVRVGA